MSNSTDSSSPLYLAPSAEIIRQYALDACRTLSRTTDKQFADPDVIQGLASFLQIIVRMGTETLNGQRS